jgi:hypothetical protein
MARPQMSFLDQLKARTGGGGAGAPAAPISFLDQIKARTAPKVIVEESQALAAEPVEVVRPKNPFGGAGPFGGGGGLSLLDQIKSRRKVEE